MLRVRKLHEIRAQKVLISVDLLFILLDELEITGVVAVCQHIH